MRQLLAVDASRAALRAALRPLLARRKKRNHATACMDHVQPQRVQTPEEGEREKNMSKFIHLEGIPNEKQREFIESDKRFVLIYGSRGLGKSWAIRRAAIKYAMEHDGSRVIILRRTREEAINAIVLPIRVELHGVAEYKTWNDFVFENGSSILVRWCKLEDDIHQFAGESYAMVCIDNAQQFTEYQLTFMENCGVKIKPLMRYAADDERADSGGILLKRRFIEKRFDPDENAEDFHAIQSSIADNQFLANSEYRKRLEELRGKAKRYAN